MFLKKTHMENIIQKSMKSVLVNFKNTRPSITFNTFYGAVEIDPYNLAIWYFFKTDEELKTAIQNGLTNKIKQLTIEEMIKNGYPISEIQIDYNPLDVSKNNFNIDHEVEENSIDNRINSLNDTISFSSEEDVMNETGGNYYQYFK